MWISTSMCTHKWMHRICSLASVQRRFCFWNNKKFYPRKRYDQIKLFILHYLNTKFMLRTSNDLCAHFMWRECMCVCSVAQLNGCESVYVYTGTGKFIENGTCIWFLFFIWDHRICKFRNERMTIVYSNAVLPYLPKDWHFP